MVIQRWQTVFLLVAVVLMAALNFVPFINVTEAAAAAPTPRFTTDAPILAILSVLVAVLLFIAIFMFKNLRVQMRITLLSMVLMCVLAVTGGFIIYSQAPDAQIVWTGAVLLLICAVVMALGAYRLMKRDYRLLRSADRLW